jgi:wyosine [tRNA(Phe)-imidazoG37] synthetase (radical SAM superfamily)
VEQVVESVKGGSRIDCISLSGSGEPTLNSDIGWVIKRLKERVSLPVAVITNGSLLSRRDVREDLMGADIVLPSLDAANEAAYLKINRPHESLEFSGIVEGLETFCKEYKGRVRLEIMLINNINNDMQQLEIFKKIINGLAVDKVQLNTVVRPPAEETARPVTQKALVSVSRFFGPGCEVIASQGGKQMTRAVGDDWEESVVAMLGRRSLSLDDIVRSTGASVRAAREGMRKLTEEKKVASVILNRRRFYLVASDQDI